MTIRGKPIRFGFKAWCLNSAKGYLIAFDVYQGATYRGRAEYEERFGKGGAALADALDRLPLHIRKIPLKLYFDNYFTSLPLIKHLTLCGYGATGTIRDNRLPKSCPAAAVKSMKALVRGSVSVCGDTNNGISVVRWKDNSVVTVASNMAGSGPLQTVKRWSSKEKKMVQVPQPHCVSEYNKKMGGTDIMDQSINAYRTNIRIKKWWWAIFSWMLDAAVQNTWLVHRTKDEHASLLDVRRQISTTLLTRCQRDVSGAGTEGATGPPRSVPTGASRSTVPDIRYDGMHHYVIPAESQRRCKREACKSRPSTACCKCNVALCVKCFRPYHSK